MSYGRRCSCCGAYLDPCERCDCETKKEAAPKLEPSKAAEEHPLVPKITDLGGFVNALRTVGARGATASWL